MKYLGSYVLRFQFQYFSIFLLHLNIGCMTNDRLNCGSFLVCAATWITHVAARVSWNIFFFGHWTIKIPRISIEMHSVKVVTFRSNENLIVKMQYSAVAYMWWFLGTYSILQTMTIMPIMQYRIYIIKNEKLLIRDLHLIDPAWSFCEVQKISMQKYNNIIYNTYYWAGSVPKMLTLFGLSGR